MNQKDEKWACPFCTYENWPKAQKCTICLAAKSSHIITDEPSQNRDIFKITPLVTDINDKSSSAFNTSATNPFNKWSCSTCTFLNWPKSIKCTQCLTPRITTSTPHHTSPVCDTAHAQPSNDKSCLESCDGHLQNDRNKCTTYSMKWTCQACTYENWPKAQKCVLCHTSNTKPEIACATYGSEEFEARKCTPPSSASQEPVALPRITANVRSNPSSGVIQIGLNRSSEAGFLQNSASLASISSCTPASNNYLEGWRLRQLRCNAREMDKAWLNACVGVLEGNPNPVIHYLAIGGDTTRKLTATEVTLLARPLTFDVGHSLAHLAIQYQRDDILALILSNSGVSQPMAKRVPSDVSRDIAADIRHHMATVLKQKKGDFSCYFVTEFVTFALPAEIEDFSTSVQQRVFDELLDRDVQKELEEESPIINWSLELTERLGSRLYALWNRSAGDCLLDSALQATWGVFDQDNSLRRALGDSLCEAAPVLYWRWKEAETLQADLLHFSLDETQWQEDWTMLLSLATQPGSALEQLHIFTLAHILRRPIIVYGVKYVKSFRGEALGYARFQGIYLPLLWDHSFCWKSPIALGYTRGHFSALVPLEPDSGDVLGAGANLRSSDELQVVFLPLMTSDHQLLPLHFLTQNEVGKEEEMIRQWLDCCVTESGVLVAQQKIPKYPLLVSQMVEEWLGLYRTLNLSSTSCPEPHPQGYSSDEDSDQE